MQKTYWSSQWIFILAAIGSAAGLGNLWRFPYLAYEHGGGAFLFAIIIANICIGIPLLMLEIALGQKTGKSAPHALATIRPIFRFVGWSALVLSFMILAYYMAVVSWGVNFFTAAFSGAWGSDTSSFFFNDILSLSEGVTALGGIAWSVVAGLVIAWLLVYFSAWKGVKSISRVVLWSATLPFIILALLIAHALTLPGAFDGIRTFLIPDWSALGNSGLWLAAFSQVFFSLSLASGIMIAYGSFQKRESEITKSALWIALGNFAVSLLSGFAVFATLGAVAFEKGVAITEVVAGGPTLTFVVIPEAINLLPAFNSLIGILFFGMLLALAIDSAFSILEAITAPLRECFTQTSSKKITALVAGACFLASLPFATGAGLYILDIMDHFIVNYGLIIIGILQAFAIGWVVRDNTFSSFIAERSTLPFLAFWNIAIRYIIPLFLITLLILNVIQELKTPYEGYPTEALIYLGLLPLLLTPCIALILKRTFACKK